MPGHVRRRRRTDSDTSITRITTHYTQIMLTASGCVRWRSHTDKQHRRYRPLSVCGRTCIRRETMRVIVCDQRICASPMYGSSSMMTRGRNRADVYLLVRFGVGWEARNTAEKQRLHQHLPDAARAPRFHIHSPNHYKNITTPQSPCAAYAPHFSVSHVDPHTYLSTPPSATRYEKVY